MKFLAILSFTTLLLPLTAVACPIGMQFNGNGCSPPYVYTGWDLMRDRRAAIDAIGSNHRNSAPPLTAEQARKLTEDMRKLEKEKEEKGRFLQKASGILIPNILQKEISVRRYFPNISPMKAAL